MQVGVDFRRLRIHHFTDLKRRHDNMHDSEWQIRR